MTEQDACDGLEALPEEELRKRLSYEDWRNKGGHVSDERAFTLLRLARESKNNKRVGIISESLSRRILVRARGFAIRSCIVPGLIGDLDEATAELGAYVWEKILGTPNNAAHAEVAFGQLFNRRAIDFQRQLFAKKRALQESLDAMQQTSDGEDPEGAEKSVIALEDDWKPDDSLQQKQEFKKLRSAMHNVLSSDEFKVLELLFDLDMPVIDVAEAIGVTTRTVQNYRIRALEKLRKELAK